MGGRPVLHWYVEKDVSPEWTDARWTIRCTNHFFWSARQPLDGGWGYGSDPQLPGIEECMSFWPGWDLSGPGISREGGELYRRQGIKVLKLQPRHILLSDWWGWCEGTAIEDSDRLRDTYGNRAPAWYRLLTQGYVAAYNGQLVEGFLLPRRGAGGGEAARAGRLPAAGRHRFRSGHFWSRRIARVLGVPAPTRAAGDR